jgi:outer membrane scaffolding protein for murein synthesis (MipA/OmpV family)
LPASSEAGRFLDYVRNYDLNDYAVGLAVSSAQNPYIGTARSTFGYPYLTAFRHPAFTRDWLLVRGGDVGFRVVTDTDWELGIVARVQTLGFGNTDSDELLGLRQRQWSVETGPLIGWRGGPVHVQLRSYWGLPSRHGGTTSELELSVPIEFQRGFFVPSVKSSFLSGDYSDYYFGVTPEEATASRPEYGPGAAMNTSLSMTLGYELTPRWLLKTTVGVEFLDSAISNSPLVDRDKLWSGSIGLAYNANIFQPRDYPGTNNQGAFEIRLGAFAGSIDTRILRDASDGARGDDVDLEDTLGITDSQTVAQFDALYRIGSYHRLEVGYFELLRSAIVTAQRDIQFGDQLFPAGADLQTSVSSRVLRLAYAYSLMRDNQKELGVRVGLSYSRLKTTLRADGLEAAEYARVEAPLPTFGIFGRLPLGTHWQLGADVDLFALEFDRYDGYMAYLSLGLERELGENLDAGFGYNFYGMRLRAKDEDLRGTLRIRHQGPKLYLSVKF